MKLNLKCKTSPLLDVLCTKDERESLLAWNSSRKDIIMNWGNGGSQRYGYDSKALTLIVRLLIAIPPSLKTLIIMNYGRRRRRVQWERAPCNIPSPSDAYEERDCSLILESFFFRWVDFGKLLILACINYQLTDKVTSSSSSSVFFFGTRFCFMEFN